MLVNKIKLHFFRQNKRNVKVFKSIAGFTLLELLITMAIIAMLAAISIFALSGARQQGRDGKRKSDLESIRSALELYKADCDKYPSNIPTAASATSLNGNTAPCNVGATNVYLNKTPADPSGSEYGYSVNGTNSTYEVCAKLENPGSNDDCTFDSTNFNYGVTNP
jgi:general secretion pathway protein G